MLRLAPSRAFLCLPSCRLARVPSAWLFCLGYSRFGSVDIGILFFLECCYMHRLILGFAFWSLEFFVFVFSLLHMHVCI